jgi:RNA polymerase sigma-70 factor (ECF subfamily)
MAPPPAPAEASAAPVAQERAEVVRAARGDGAAFEALYRRHASRVFGLCLRLTADRAQAEELTQECFVRAWQNLASFRAEAAFGTWLHRIAVNLALGGFRSRSRRGLRVVEGVDDGLLEQVAADRPAPEAGIDLERAIATLPTGARAVFVLHDVEGWQHDEIAQQLGLAVGTSKAQLHRARRLLRERLER